MSGIGFRRLARALVSIVMLAGLVACSNDELSDGDASSTPKAARPEEYCAGTFAIETAPDPQIDFESLTPAQQADETKKYAAATLRPLVDKMIAAAPTEIKEPAGVADAAVKALQESGDFEAAFRNPDTIKAFNTLHAFDLTNCGWKQVDVAGTEYAFAGVPATVPAGITSFEFDNKGTEQHEMVIFRRNDGETMSFDQLLAIPEEDEALKHLQFISAAGGDPGGEEDLYTVADVKPGDYVMVCFVPVGSTPAAVQAAQASGKGIEGPPHFTRGMKQEFKVA